MRIRACVLAAAAVVLWQLPARAGDPASAREQLKIGYLLAQGGKCDEAIPHLVESLRLDPKAITLINLADCEEKVGKLSDALAHWGDARSRAQTDGQKPIEEEAMTRAGALEPRLARLTVVLAPTAPKDATVERDGVALGPPSMGIALPVDPGPHTVVVKASGRPDTAIQFTLSEGEAKRVEVDVGGFAARPPDVGGDIQPRSATNTSPLVFIGFGVAAAGLTVGTITGLMAIGAGDDAKTACPNRVCDQPKKLDDIESGRTLGLVSTISFVAAGAGAAVGVYGFVWGGGRATTKPGPSVGVALGPASFALRGRF